MGDAENFVSEALQEGHSMPDIIAAMGQHSNPQLQQFAQNWNNVANQPAYQPGMGPGASAQDTETVPTNNMTGALDWAQQNPGQAFAYGLGGASALGAAGVAGKRAVSTTFDALDALRSRYLPNQQEINDTSKTNAYANQVQAQNAQLQAGSEAPEIDAHEEYLKQHERRQAEIKTQMEEAKLEAIKSKGVKPEGKPKPVSPQDQAILDAIARGNVKPVTGPTPAPPPPTEFAAATQQTNPMSNAGNAPANEVPKNEAPTETVEPTTKVESATESGGQTATMDNNKSSEKTTLPEDQVSKGATVSSIKGAKAPPARSKEAMSVKTAEEPFNKAYNQYSKKLGGIGNGAPSPLQGEFDTAWEDLHKNVFKGEMPKSQGGNPAMWQESEEHIRSQPDKYAGIIQHLDETKSKYGKTYTPEKGFASLGALGGLATGALGGLMAYQTGKEALKSYKEGDTEMAVSKLSNILNSHPLGMAYNQLFGISPEDLQTLRKGEKSVFEKPEIKSSMTRQVTSPRK